MGQSGRPATKPVLRFGAIVVMLTMATASACVSGDEAMTGARLDDTLSRPSDGPVRTEDGPVLSTSPPDDPLWETLWPLENTGQQICVNRPSIGADGALQCRWVPAGTLDVDLNAPEAWQMFVPRQDDPRPVVIGQIDTGIDYEHPELADVIWHNPGESGTYTDATGATRSRSDDGVDNDGNGYVDDVHGVRTSVPRLIEAADGTLQPNPAAGSPMDFWYGHGTAMAGVMAARANDGRGTAGLLGHDDIRPHVRIVTCAVTPERTEPVDLLGLAQVPPAYPEDVVECIDYFLDLVERHDVDLAVINASGGMSRGIKAVDGNGFLLVLQARGDLQLDGDEMRAAAQRLADAGILVSASAGNFFWDIDESSSTAYYPAASDFDNVISVAGHDHRGERFRGWACPANGGACSQHQNTGSSWGARSVDLAAPGGLIAMSAVRAEVFAATCTESSGCDPSFAVADYSLADGTSQAAAYVSALIALMRAHQGTSHLQNDEILRRLISSGTPLVDFERRTVSGVMLRAASNGDGRGALDCSGAYYQHRLEPDGYAVEKVPGQQVPIRVRAFECEHLPAQLSAHVSPTGEVISLHDDGDPLHADEHAGDGVFSAMWTVPADAPGSAVAGSVYTIDFGEDSLIGTSRELAVTTVITVDNLDDETSHTLWWWAAILRPGFLGPNYQIAFRGSSGSQEFRWRPEIEVAGSYEVFARWPANSAFATDAPFTIEHAGGSNTVRVNQKINGATWVSLGTYSFAAGTAEIKLNNNADGTVVADAIRLVWRE